MPLTESLPNGPASKVAGGSHDSGPVRTKVERGAGAAGASAGAGAGAAAGAGAGVAGVWAPAIKAKDIVAQAVIFRMQSRFEYIGTVPPEKKSC